MKILTLLTLLLFSVQAAVATHLLGGYIRATPVTGSTLTYNVTATFYLDGVVGSVAVSDMNSISICFGDGATALATQVSRQPLPADKGVSMAVFQVRHTYAGPGTYVLTVPVTNRSPVRNISNPIQEALTLTTTFLAGTNQTPLPIIPETNFRLGLNQRATISLAASDPDGDSLVYGLGRPLTTSNSATCNQQPISGYQFPNDLTRQGTFTLNARTGELVWNAPIQEGRYAVALTIDEYRQGNLISQTTHEITIFAVDLAGTPGVIPPYEPASVGNVRTIVTALSNEPDADIQLSVFPNPVDDCIQVIVQTSNPATATVQLLDASGRSLHEMRFGRAARRHEQVVSMSSLSPGLYVLSANVNGRLLVRKVVKR